jgi:RNA polymerase sigma-70 factor (ECF subfamily)
LTEKNEKGARTSLGGPAAEFPRTTLALVDRLRDPAGSDGRQAFDELCRRYWKPVYCFIRAAWAKGNEDAKDLCQDFFAWLLEKDLLARYRRERASFRTYLKVQLRGFVADHHKAASRQKRGGDVRIVGWGDGEESLERFVRDSQATDPETLFDRAWLMAIVEHAVEVVHSGTPAERFRVFEEIDLAAGAERPTYAVVAERLGIPESQVRDTLAAVRRSLREELRAELLRQTRDPDEFQEEWNAFLGL